MRKSVKISWTSISQVWDGVYISMLELILNEMMYVHKELINLDGRRITWKW